MLTSRQELMDTRHCHNIAFARVQSLDNYKSGAFTDTNVRWQYRMAILNKEK
jgi:hypothetical protein